MNRYKHFKAPISDYEPYHVDGVEVAYQEAADGGVDLPEDVTDHVERRDQGQLEGVVYHHVDEHDVARVLVEDAEMIYTGKCN